MHSSSTGLVTFFWGTILAWGDTFLACGAQAVTWEVQQQNAPPRGTGTGLLRFSSVSLITDQIKNLFACFVDLEKAYDRAFRDKLR